MMLATRSALSKKLRRGTQTNATEKCIGQYEHHSDLKAWAGSIDAARRAGMIPATQAATITVAIAPDTIFGSALVIS